MLADTKILCWCSVSNEIKIRYESPRREVVQYFPIRECGNEPSGSIINNTYDIRHMFSTLYNFKARHPRLGFLYLLNSVIK
jgi:hypothetical protein